MQESTEKEIIKILKRDNITDKTDLRIESIADGFPEEYSNEEEYITFQIEIADLI